MTTIANVPIKDSLLYVRTDATVSCGKVVLSKGQEATFETYFGSVAVDVFKKYTDVKKLTASLTVSGPARVEVYVFRHGGKDETENVLLYAIDDYEEKERQVKGSFPLPSSGFVYCKVISLGEKTVLSEIKYNAEAETLNNVSVAIVICTYKREEYVKKNVRRLEEYKAISGEDLSVFVVDNGGTLQPEDVAGATLVKNPNLGGSGGFCRGMAEAKKAGFTHVLLMDDDISFEEEIVARIYAFLRYVNKVDEVGIGASMITEEEPTTQFELGATWDGDRLRGLGKNVDLTDPQVLLDNATRDSAEYTAWWCCCMPLSIVDKVGYPMPMFIKNDDVEYGIRSGLKWAFPSGVGVWHTSFDSKYSPFLEYYIKRNELISNCLNRKRGVVCQFLKLVRSGSLQIVQQRYSVIPFMLAGYEDFLKGPEYLKNLDAEEKNKELIALQPRQYSAEELFSMGYDVSVPVHGKKRNKLWQVITLNGQLLPTFFYKKADRVRVLDCNHCPPRDFFGATETVQFNYLSGKGFVTKQKRTELFRWCFALVKMGVKMLFTYRKVRREYQDKAAFLTSLEFWESKWRTND